MHGQGISYTITPSPQCTLVVVTRHSDSTSPLRRACGHATNTVHPSPDKDGAQHSYRLQAWSVDARDTVGEDLRTRSIEPVRQRVRMVSWQGREQRDVMRGGRFGHPPLRAVAGIALTTSVNATTHPHPILVTNLNGVDCVVKSIVHRVFLGDRHSVFTSTFRQVSTSTSLYPGH